MRINRNQFKIHERIIVVLGLACIIFGAFSYSQSKEVERLLERNQLLVNDIKQARLDGTEAEMKYKYLNGEFQLIFDANSENRELLSKLTAEVSDLKELYTRTDFVTMDEYELLLHITEAEATSFGVETKVHIVDVIQNRVESNKFPNTINKVVFQKNAFTPTFDGRLYSLPITQSTIDAVQYALRNDDTTNGATFFMNPKYSDPKNIAWFRNNLQLCMVDSAHEFYKE